MTRKKDKELDTLCKLDPKYEEQREELIKLTMLDILNLKMKVKKELKEQSECIRDDDEEDAWALVNRIGCEH